MKSMLLFFLIVLATGCSHNYSNVPADNFANKVKVLGVAPIIIDYDSDIKHPQKLQLINILTEMNRKHEMQLVRKLKATGNFFSVALLDDNSEQFFSNLFFRREKRDDATINYNKYFWKNDELKNYIKKNNLDAVMLIIISGLSKTDKISSNSLLSHLTSDYNYLIMTAQILDTNGTVLWEYPYFRRRYLSHIPMINLQYPDFNEAEANLSTVTEAKFKTIEGIKRALELKDTDHLLRETSDSKLYTLQFDEIISLMKHDSEKDGIESKSATIKSPNLHNQSNTADSLQGKQTTAQPARATELSVAEDRTKAVPENKPVLREDASYNQEEKK